MTRKFRPLTPQLLRQVPDMCAGCVFWESADRLEARCGSELRPRARAAWAEHVVRSGATAGVSAVEDGEVLGFIKYAPSALLPAGAELAGGPPAPRTPR